MNPYLSINEVIEGYRSLALNPVDYLDMQLARIERHNPVLNVFTHWDFAKARETAKLSAERWRSGKPRGALDGISFVAKDNMMVSGWPFRRGSKITSPNPVSETSPAVERCLEEGAILLGLTTMPEFGAGPVTISPLSGITRNPWNPKLQPGGSSGGAAAALAAGFCTFSIGSDAGGSVRIPASLTGVVGMKPTGALVPMYPPSSAGGLACIGPLTHTVQDTVLLLGILCRPDLRDPLALPYTGNSFCEAVGPDDLQDVRIGWSTDLGYAPLVDKEVSEAVAAVATKLANLGAAVKSDHPNYGDPIDTYLVMLKSGYQYSLRKESDENRRLLGPELREILNDTPAITLTDYLQAQEACKALGRKSAVFHNEYDVLLTPTVATSAFAAERSYPESFEAFKNRRAWTPFTLLFNLTQQPAISLPCGLTSTGLPIGVHLAAARGHDATILRVAHALQRAQGQSFHPDLK